jgi:glutathione S-transferase
MVWGVFVQRVVTRRQGETPDAATIRESLRAAGTCLEVLEAGLEGCRFLAGDGLSLADLHAVPMLLYFSLTPEGADLLASRRRLNLWLEEMVARPSVMRTRSVYE